MNNLNPWTTNSIMEWKDPRKAGDPALPNRTDTAGQWITISDHGRQGLNVSFERIGTGERMANGMMRRYSIAKKRTWSASWDNFPNKQVSFLANGQSGDWMEKFYRDVDGPFLMRLRTGQDRIVGTTIPTVQDNITVVEVMITDFSKQVVKRGAAFDLWTMDISLEEV